MRQCYSHMCVNYYFCYSKKKKKKEGEATPIEQAAPPPEKLPGKFFEVSGSLIDLLKPAEKKPFSLLSMFGSADSDHTDMKQKLNGQCRISVSLFVVCGYTVPFVS